MTAEREAMTLEQASDLLTEWLPICAGTEATKAWSVVRAYLSRAAKPVYQARFKGDRQWWDETQTVFASLDHARFETRVLYTHPSEDALDAKRYRWLRDGSYQRTQAVTFAGHAYWDEELDAAIDAAIAKANDNG